MPIVRRLLPEDALAYRHLRLEALQLEPSSYGTTYQEEVVKDKLAFETYIERQDSTQRMFGAFVDDELVGITCWVQDTRTRLAHRGKVGQVYVRASQRGKGIGRALMQAVIDDAFADPAIEALSLEVVNSNPSAIRLYESMGFKTYGVFERYFKTEDGYLDQRFMVVYN